jgi:hypothetical protein
VFFVVGAIVGGDDDGCVVVAVWLIGSRSRSRVV